MAKKKMTAEEMRRETAKSVRAGGPSQKGMSMREMRQQLEASSKKTVRKKTK